MATVQNYGQQSYNPPVWQSFLGRNWCVGTATLSTGSQIDIFHLDNIVIYRGGPVTTGAVEPDIPSAGLIVRCGFSCDSSGMNFMPRLDLGPVTVNLLPGAQTCPNGFTFFTFDSPGGYGIWGSATRISGSTTTVKFHISVTEY